MGKRNTRGKRKRRKTRRGGVSPENIRNVLHQIYTQVAGQEEENGFYGRLYTLIEDDHLNELAQENPLLDHQLQVIADALRHLEDTVDAAQGERTLDYVQTLREDLNTQLENMVNLATGIENELSNEMVREIRAEIVFLRDTFDQITH